MARYLSIKWHILYTLLVFTNLCFSQSKQFRHITHADGISQSEIYSFLEDAAGFMWFGTVDGLNRYDGYNVTTFNTDKDSPHSISNNTVRCLVEDDFGRIWIGTDDGLCVYDSRMEKIHQIKLNRFNEKRLTINAALIDRGQLYLGTSLGFLRIDVSTNELSKIGKSAHQIKIVNDNSDYSFIACTRGQDGKVWVATATSLYQLISNGNDSISVLNKQLELKGTLPDLRNLVEDEFGNLWIVFYQNGFIKYNPKTGQIKHFKKNLPNRSVVSNKISSVTIDQTGHLWIGTHDKGLLFLEKKYLNDENPNFQLIEHDLSNDRSLNSNLIYSLYVSKDNLLWIGTIGSGINIYDPNRNPFHYYNLQNAANQSSHSTNFIRAVYADEQDNIWIGTHSNGLFLLDRGNLEKIDKIGFGTESIFHINDAGNGNTFVCSNLGISLVKKVNKTLEIKSTLPIGPAFYTTRPENGIFWVASLYGVRKCKLNNGEIILEQTYTTDSKPALSFNNCRVLYFQKEANELFIGTEGGGLNILGLNPEMVPIHTSIYQKGDSTNSISNNYIRSIIEDSNSDIWIGTYEGLNKMKVDPASGKAIFKTYTRKNGLPNNTIQSIVEDNQKNLWIGTNQGLCKFNRPAETFTQYTLNDGIQSNEFSEHAIFKKWDNEIIIGGINGINTFYPEQITSSNFEPNTTITDFYLFNKKIRVGEKTSNGKKSPLIKSISKTDSIFLKPNQNSLGFEFSAMIYNSPEKIQYAYLLEGFEKEWNITDADNRRANYTNLGFGDFTFKVKAINNDGLWEETPKSVFISISPPLYYTTLAFILYALLAILAFIFFTNYSILRYTTKKKIILENQHNKKVRELEELRTRFLINISHDLRTPITLISSPLEIIQKNRSIQPETKSLLNLVQRNVKKLKDMTEQLLDISKVETGILTPQPQNLDIVSFVKSEVLSFEDAFNRKGIDLEVKSEEPSYKMSFDPDMISKVLFNILSNALKHTHEGKVTMNISAVPSPSSDKAGMERQQNYIKISISDTGVGIDEADIARVFERFYQGKEQNKKGYGIGLSHCKDLIEAHNGSIDVASKKGVGTIFNIHLPNIQKPESPTVQSLPILKNETAELTVAEDLMAEVRGEAATHSITILLVEDNPDLRGFLAQELRKKYQVLEAENGEEGLKIAQVDYPDLIISDVMMPNMNGLEFCKAVKSNIKTSHIPVILLTAKVDKETKYEGLEIGADDYISKPFEMEYLFLKIINLLKNRERLRKMFQLNANLEPSKVTVTSIDEQFLIKLMAEIEKGIADADFSINALERELGMSHSSFYNKIKSLTGQSANDLVFSARMKRAKQILEDTGKIRVSEVAYMVGFSDPKYFSKRFKEFFGASPSHFIKK